MTDPRAVLAAHNNADLYQAMYTAHGLGFERPNHAFIGIDKPPPYYANMTTLTPNCVAETLADAARVAGQFGGAVGLKDSFSELDLSDHGFSVLFGASWIWRAPAAAQTPAGWQVIDTERELLRWEEAWKTGGSPMPGQMFPASMLQDTSLRFLGRKTAFGYDAGCIGNLSLGCIGISNVFAVNAGTPVFAQAADAVAAESPGLPIVGYESGADLEAAKQAGFETTGDLQIWVTRAAVFAPGA